MAKRIMPTLVRIENNQSVTKETNHEFIHHLQSALLLALREQRILNAMQHRQAEEKLKQQRRERVGRKQEES